MRHWDTVLIALAFGGAIACFVGTSTFAERSMGAITTRSHELSELELPCVIYVSAIQNEMHDVERALEIDSDVAAEYSPGRSWLPTVLEQLARSEDGLASLSPMEGEATRWSAVRTAVDEVRTRVPPIWQRVIAGERGEQLQADIQQTKRLMAAVEETLCEMVTAASKGGRQAAVDVDRARVRSGEIAYGLDALSVLITMGLAVGVLALQHRHSNM